MESISAYRPRNRHMNDRIQPGSVGPVGDVLGGVRLKQSTPDMPMRWDKVFSLENAPRMGSNVQDGQQVSWQSGGGFPEVVSTSFGGGRQFRTSRGYRIEDITEADMMVEPFVSSLGDYTWRNKVATVYQALRTGEQFLPLPGGYQPHPGELLRGGNFPTVVATAGGIEPPAGNNVVISGDMDMTNLLQPSIVGAYGARRTNQNLAPVVDGYNFTSVLRPPHKG